ncbi:Hypothetical protein CINCED_3A009330 [Cinara cedri]|uniref:Uncharacterized protein n=1 Tax=Cinara cedri TaxID=506608 RepID=A0A5E4MGU1_9HEMI|nr:Hypothetical protein CINCED_3A009330 [Cinara cedri]
MNRERRFGRRSVVQNLVKLTPEIENEEKVSNGAKKALFNDDEPFLLRRSTLKPLHEINNFHYSSSKSKSHDTLHEENTFEVPKSTYISMKNKDDILLSPISKTGLLDINKHKREFSEPVLQSNELYHSLIDSPCTKLEKVNFNNALSSATKYLLSRHLESVNQNTNIFQEKTSVYSTDKNYLNEFKTPNLIDLSTIPKERIHQTDCQTQTLNTPVLTEEIEQQKKNEIDDIRQTKLQCCNLIRNRFKEIELEIEKNFGVLENKVTENYDKLLKKVYDAKNDSDESQALDNSVVTVKEDNTAKEKNYTRMTGAFGVLNNLNKECSFLKTPKAKGGKTREEMLKQGTLTPGTMSYVLQEQLMHLNSSS